MLQADIRRSEYQLNESNHHLDIIEHLFDFHGNIIVGTVVELKQEKQNIWIFIGPAIGDVIVNQIKIKTVSQASPFGQLLMGKTIGDKIIFNQKSFSIVNCF